MSRIEQSAESAPPDEVRAEAAAWIAQLHDDRRSSGLEAQVNAWLDESETHRHAFDRITQVWERTGAIRMRARHNVPERRNRRLIPLVTAMAAAVTVAVIAVAYLWRGNVVATGIGEQEARFLPDGTRVMLNTNTRIEVNYDDSARRVRLIRGEAWFDVAKRPTWPFIVSADGREIRALGTSFIVRHDEIQAFSVTLVEGKVSVVAIADKKSAPTEQLATLAPGQRLTLSKNHAPSVDRPEIERLTAWERGRVEFEQTTLSDAVGEMNRYSAIRIDIADPELARLRVGGVFRAGDSKEFARIVSAAFGLRVDQGGGQIVLSWADGLRRSTQPP